MLHFYWPHHLVSWLLRICGQIEREGDPTGKLFCWEILSSPCRQGVVLIGFLLCSPGSGDKMVLPTEQKDTPRPFLTATSSYIHEENHSHWCQLVTKGSPKTSATKLNQNIENEAALSNFSHILNDPDLENCLYISINWVLSHGSWQCCSL